MMNEESEIVFNADSARYKTGSLHTKGRKLPLTGIENPFLSDAPHHVRQGIEFEPLNDARYNQQEYDTIIKNLKNNLKANLPHEVLVYHAEEVPFGL